MSERLHRIVEDKTFWSQRNARSTCFVKRKGAVTLLTKAKQIEFPTRAAMLSIDACRPKCISGVLKYALARRLSILMCFRSDEMRSRSTPVEPNAFPIRSNALSLDACRPKCSKTNVANRHLTSLEDLPKCTDTHLTTKCNNCLEF